MFLYKEGDSIKCYSCNNNNICTVFELAKKHLGGIGIAINDCKYFRTSHSENVQSLESNSERKPKMVYTDYKNVKTQENNQPTQAPQSPKVYDGIMVSECDTEFLCSNCNETITFETTTTCSKCHRLICEVCSNDGVCNDCINNPIENVSLNNEKSHEEILNEIFSEKEEKQ